MVWREKEMPKIRAMQMDNFRRLSAIKIMDKVLNAQIRKLCRVMKRGGWKD